MGGKVLKRDQEKGRGRERKTVETRVKRSCVLPRTHGRAGVVWMRKGTPSGRRTGARGLESRRSEYVLLSASRVEKARGNFQVLKRSLITRDRVWNSLLHFSSRYTRHVNAYLKDSGRVEDGKSAFPHTALWYLLHTWIFIVLYILWYILQYHIYYGYDILIKWEPIRKYDFVEFPMYLKTNISDIKFRFTWNRISIIV